MSSFFTECSATDLALCFDGGLLKNLDALLLFFHDFGLPNILPQELCIAALGILQLLIHHLHHTNHGKSGARSGREGGGVGGGEGGI